MPNLKTVEGKSMRNTDPLRSLQKEDVARMRASLLSCQVENPASVKLAIQNVTVMRIHHQVVRIVRYLDLMDKLEEKLYGSIECTLENAADANPSTWMMLLKAQEQLQKMMIESHKLLQPYLDLEEFAITDLMPSDTNADNPTTLILDQPQREKIRNSAQAMLIEINANAG